jgi:hypothetical protein
VNYSLPSLGRVCSGRLIWLSPAQSLFVPSPAGLMTILYSLATLGCVPRYTAMHWVLFFIAFSDSRGCGRGILTRLHTEGRVRQGYEISRYIPGLVAELRNGSFHIPGAHCGIISFPVFWIRENILLSPYRQD